MSTGLPRMALIPAFAGLLAVVASAQRDGARDLAGPDRPQAELQGTRVDDPWSSLEPNFPLRESPLLQRRSAGDDSPVLAGRSEGIRHSWTRTIGALAGVVGLIVLLAWGYRAMSGGQVPLLGKARRPGLIEVISRTPLSARQSLCLVRIGPRMVLIGQSQDALRVLDVIDDPELVARLAGEVAQKRPGSSRQEFQHCLEHEASDYADEIHPDGTPDGRRVAHVQQRLGETIRRVRQALVQT